MTFQHSKIAQLWWTSQDIAGWVWKLETFGSKIAHLWQTSQERPIRLGWKLERWRTSGGHLKILQVGFRNLKLLAARWCTSGGHLKILQVMFGN